jgi:hypothetical protein
MKILIANIYLSGNMLDALRSFGYKGHHGQFSIICKCKSMADGNRKCIDAGLGDGIFKSGSCSEMSNINALAAVEQSDIAFCAEGVTGSTYVTIEQVMERSKSAG